jgi:sarcosine oxidase
MERSAGILAVDDCVRAHVDAARSLGAEVRQETVVAWERDGSGVEVRTNIGSYTAARLVVTAGPWAGQVLGQCGVPLSVMRQVALWFSPKTLTAFRRDVFPVFIADMPYGFFYGMPMLDEAGVKVARHYGATELAGPEEIERSVRPDDEVPVRRFLRDVLPEGDGPSRRASVCVYTLTPDRHFILDRHPEQENVVIAAGFSGHGYKFAPVVGEILADLAEQGRTRWPIGLFRINRFRE